MGVTYKQGVADQNNDAKIGLETKFKSVVAGSSFDGTLKQDGSFSVEYKTDYLAVSGTLLLLIMFIHRDLLMLKDSL